MVLCTPLAREITGERIVSSFIFVPFGARHASTIESTCIFRAKIEIALSLEWFSDVCSRFARAVPTTRLACESGLDVSDDSVIFCAERTFSITFSGVIAEYIGIHAKHRAYVTSLASLALPSRYVLVEFTNLW
jgi:hypothetical protein